MKNFKSLLSLMLSCSIAGLSAVSPSVSAVCANGNTPVKYDSTKSGESKAPDSDEPFKVFEIYNAYYGITTTAKQTTATTKKTTATTKKTTTTTTATKKTTTATTSATSKTTAKTTTKAPQTTAVQTVSTSSATESTATTVQTTTEPETTTTTSTASLMPEPFSKGIDVSQFQNKIDWQAVKDSGVDFVIIRAGYGKEFSQVDPAFYYNIESAKAVGLDVGIYWYSYADDSETAKREAEVCYETIKNYSIEYPVYFDIEEPKHANMSIAQASVIADTFCTEMQNRGYFVGVYSYANFLQSHIYRSVLEKYDVWVAQYSENLTAYNGHFSVWQYSSKGEVSGINTNVDMNYCYKDYSQVIHGNPDPNFIPPETTATTVSKNLCDIVSVGCTAVDWETYDNDIAMLAVNDEDGEPDFELLAQNISAVKEKARKIGLVWYADKTVPEEMTEDAEKLHAFIEDYQFEYPIYLDMTNPAIAESELSSDEISELIRSFCEVFDTDKKHYIGVRGYDDFLTDKVNDDIYKVYDVWLVTDDDSIRFGNKYGVISRLISEDGISYYENECLRNYPAIMITYHLNGF